MGGEGGSVHSRNKTRCVWQMQDDQHGCALCGAVGAALSSANSLKGLFRNMSCVSIPQIITHSIPPPDAHTTNLAATQRNKNVPMCAPEVAGGQAGVSSTQGKLPTKFKCKCSCRQTTQDGCKHPEQQRENKHILK